MSVINFVCGFMTVRYGLDLWKDALSGDAENTLDYFHRWPLCAVGNAMMIVVGAVGMISAFM